jgi:hypothetical protein
MLYLFEDPCKPSVLWTLLSLWPKAKDTSRLARRVRLLFRVLTDRIELDSPEFRQIQHECVDHQNLAFFERTIEIKKFQNMLGQRRIFGDDLDQLNRFLLTGWDTTHGEYPELYRLTDAEICKAFARFRKGWMVSTDMVKKRRQRLGLTRPRNLGLLSGREVERGRGTASSNDRQHIRVPTLAR